MTIFSDILLTPYWMGMPTKEAVAEYSARTYRYTGPGAKLKNNLVKYWKQQAELGFSAAIAKAKYLYYMKHYSFGALLEKIADAPKQDEVFSWNVMDRSC